MRSHLVRHFAAARTSKGLSVLQLARLVGYTNIVGGCNRIRRFEERGVVHADLLRKLAAALEIEEETIEALIAQDRREFVRAWDEWADQPIAPHILVPILSGALKTPYRREPLAADIHDLAAAERYASRIGSALSSSICLVWSRRLSIWFDAAGKVAVRKIATPDDRLPGPLRPSHRPGLQLADPLPQDRTLQLIDWPIERTG
ncbi:MAG: helix-turn-helix transcriptional regulator [Planctomycetales bacterium]